MIIFPHQAWLQLKGTVSATTHPCHTRTAVHCPDFTGGSVPSKDSVSGEVRVINVLVGACGFIRIKLLTVP